MKFSKISGRVSKILRRDLEFWERVLWNFKLRKLAPLFLRGTLPANSAKLPFISPSSMSPRRSCRRAHRGFFLMPPLPTDGLNHTSYYGRRLDPNTKAFSAAYNDAVDIANKNLLTFLSLKYVTIRENMHLSPEIKHFQRRKTGLPILRKQLKSFFLQFPKKKSGGVDTAQTIKASFLSLKTSKNQ